MTVVEPIQDADPIYRLVDSPFMYDAQKDLIWGNVFMFTNQKCSVVWSRYAPTSEDVKKIACEREAAKRQANPEMRHTGYTETLTRKVRAIKIAAGHGLSVYHAPHEGIHHAEITYEPGQPAQKIRKNERADLRLRLQRVFGTIVLQSCS